MEQPGHPGDGGTDGRTDGGDTEHRQQRQRRGKELYADGGMAMTSD